MKTNISPLASEVLTPEENAMLTKHDQAGRKSNPAAKVNGIEVRAGMCEALAELSESMRAMLGLMGRHNFSAALSNEAFMAYSAIMERIGTAAVKASDMVERSRALDQKVLLASMRGETETLQ